ncbi:unnamed protein product [Owenia fusiformis]|uniref:Uncharacterized protein n=1 Tax=Owenia fusiformis TaxID=6347 RepID=A0A8J1T4M0_OWEFU|nr:unnamed protein product [Owenia fusiformis]
MLSAVNALRILTSPLNNYISKNMLHSSGAAQAKVAVVLAGCGVYDGSEVHEASACLVHLSRAKAEVGMFAPDINQMHVVDHIAGAPDEKDTRNVLKESARIARGKISALSNLKATDYDAIIFPGGFGAAKNLCTFGVDGSKCSVNNEAKRVIEEFHANKKPIGCCCIAPALVARVLPGVEVTMGSDKEEDGRFPYAGTVQGLLELGAKHVNKGPTECHVDEKNKIVSAPAYMCETGLHEIFDGIGQMVNGTLKLVKS